MNNSAFVLIAVCMNLCCLDFCFKLKKWRPKLITLPPQQLKKKMNKIFCSKLSLKITKCDMHLRKAKSQNVLIKTTNVRILIWIIYGIGATLVLNVASSIIFSLKFLWLPIVRMCLHKGCKTWSCYLQVNHHNNILSIF